MHPSAPNIAVSALFRRRGDINKARDIGSGNGCGRRQSQPRRSRNKPAAMETLNSHLAIMNQLHRLKELKYTIDCLTLILQSRRIRAPTVHRSLLYI